MEIKSPSTDGIRLVSSRRHFNINRDPVNGFGFNVAGGIDKPYIPGFTGIFITKIRSFDLDGINEGDQILSVNGVQLANRTHEEALKILNEAAINSTFLIETNSEMRIASRASEPNGPSASLFVRDGDDDTFIEGSLPSSNLSNLSGRSGVRTRESSTSTINQSVLREENANIRQHWAIDEDETTIDKSRSPSPPNETDSEGEQQSESETNSSLGNELLYVSIGVVALGTILYFGYRHFLKK
ncbi:hypothetical protein niasHS_010981 [Heterodera schachtii]|uniref:PDZ domain-containing protein n=1 Tax=Heterodera schachtii TaxID=97005 RepID=A0ABD2IT51_HETSC